MNKQVVQQQLQAARQLQQINRWPEAEPVYQRILAVAPDNADALHEYGNLLHQTQRSAQAVEFLRRAAAARTGDADIRNNLGVALTGVGQLPEAVLAFAKASELRYTNPSFHQNRSQVLGAMGRWEEAAAAARSAVEVSPNSAEALAALASALLQSGKADEAIVIGERAVKLAPAGYYGLATLAHAQMLCGRVDEAIAVYRRVIAVAPTNAGAFSNLGNALQQRGQVQEAMQMLARAVQLDPKSPDARNNYGNVLKDLARLDESIVEYRHAIALQPQRAVFGSNLVYARWFQQACNPAMVLSESKAWANVHTDPVTAAAPAHPVPTPAQADPARPVRIGFISSDFRQHPVGRLIGPLFFGHDPSRVHIVLFTLVARDDEVSERLYAAADEVHRVKGRTYDGLAAAVREVGVDVLIDLTLHMGGSLLPVYASKPAPVIATYLAYCATSGMKAMDYCISDVNLDPGTADRSPFHSEQMLRLAHCYWCYDAPADAPPVNESPAEKNGYVTFGSFNSYTKLNPGVFAVWAEVMRAVPTAHLALVVPGGPPRQAEVGAMLARLGIAPGRVRMHDITTVPNYFRHYLDIDVALDPFPYCGGTTSMDALYLGSPVVTLEGKWATARAGVTILKNVGHPEWIAQSTPQYVQIAAALAADVPRLAELRRTLRGEMERSPIMDHKRFAHDFEDIMIKAWQRYCQSRGGGATAQPAAMPGTFSIG